MKRPSLYVVSVLSTLAVVASAAGANMLADPGFEFGTGNWLGDGGGRGNWTPPGLQEELLYYFPGYVASSTIFQQFDLAGLGYDADRLATGGYWAEFGGYQASYPKWWTAVDDEGQISLVQQKSDYSDNGSTGLGWQLPTVWTLFEGAVQIKPSTTRVTYAFETRRNGGALDNDDAYLDSAFLEIHESDIWTWGSIGGPRHFGTGDWTVEDELGIGSGGDGNLAVTNSRILTTNDSVRLGASSGRTGAVRLDSGTWNASGEVWVGDAGTGVVDVAAAGIWNTTNRVYLGNEDTADGTVNLGGTVSARAF